MSSALTGSSLAHRLKTLGLICVAAVIVEPAQCEPPAAVTPGPAVVGAAAGGAVHSPGAVADYEALLAVRSGRLAGYYGGKLLYAAAASRDDLLAVAMDRLARGEGDERALVFAVDVIAERWDDAAVAALDRAMGDAALPRVVRGMAQLRLYTMTGDQDLDPEGHGPYVDDRRPLDEQVASLREKMRTRPPLTDGRHLRLLEKKFLQCEKLLAECAEPGADPENRRVWEVMSIAQTYLDFGGDERERATILVEHLRRLRAMPRGVDDEGYDQAVGALQLDTLWRLQSFGGPLDGLEIEHESRDSIDAVIDQALKWWESVKEMSATERRMERLAARGYRVAKKDDGAVVSAELLRAVRAGTAGEARGAADVLRSLGLDCGTVPLPDRWSPQQQRARVEVVHSMIRGQVSARAAELMLDKGWPGWDGEKWVISPGERRNDK